MSKTAYKILDLVTLTVITAVAESLDVWVFNAFQSQFYALSIALAMGAIAIYRWNAWGLVIPVTAGASSVLVRFLLGQECSLGLWLAYTVGYLGMAVCLVWFIKKDKKTFLKSFGHQAGYYFSGVVAVELVRTLCQITNGAFWKIALTYYALDLLNVFFGLLIFVIACHQKNLVVDMKDYLAGVTSQPSSATAREEKENVIKLEEMSESEDVNDAALLDGGTLSPEQLHEMNAPKDKAEHKESKFDQENAAVDKYHADKK